VLFRSFHRDIKPANIIFTADGCPTLIDFDTARNVAGQTHGATLVGTFGYMPPEQLGGTVDASSDVYSTAATALHALTGRTPMELLDRSGLSLSIPDAVPSPELRRWFERALRPAREERFGSAAHARHALRDGSALGPVTTSAPRRLLVFGALASVLALGLVTAVVASRGPAPVVGMSRPVAQQGSTAELPLVTSTDLPADLAPTSLPVNVYSARVTAASEHEAFLWVDLENATNEQLTACADVPRSEPQGLFACSPVGVPRGRGFYTLRITPSANAPAATKSDLLGVRLWRADGTLAQHAYFRWPHEWTKP
jgi:serine/threonine-protein kinase